MSETIDLNRNTGLPALGTHTFKTTAVNVDVGGSGYESWRYDCAVQDKGEDQGKKATLWLSMSPQARWKVDEFLDAVDAPRSGKGNAESFVGKVFRGTVIHNERDGKVYANVDTFLPAGSQASLPMNDAPEKNAIPEDVAKSKRPPF